MAASLQTFEMSDPTKPGHKLLIRSAYSSISLDSLSVVLCEATGCILALSCSSLSLLFYSFLLLTLLLMFALFVLSLSLLSFYNFSLSSLLYALLLPLLLLLLLCDFVFSPLVVLVSY